MAAAFPQRILCACHHFGRCDELLGNRDREVCNCATPVKPRSMWCMALKRCEHQARSDRANAVPRRRDLSVFDLGDFLGVPFYSLGDGVPMGGARHQGLENHHVQRPLPHLGLRLRFASRQFSSRLSSGDQNSNTRHQAIRYQFSAKNIVIGGTSSAASVRFDLIPSIGEPRIKQ